MKPALADTPSAPNAALPVLARLFLRLGLTAFGGPAAHIAMMQEEIVERRQWMQREQFLDLLGAANLIPGPSSTELANLIGFRLGGAPGLMLAGMCFILPAFLLVLAIAWAYMQFGTLPAVGLALYGVKPVVIAIVAQALWNLGRTAVKSRALAVLGALAAVPAFLGISPILILLSAGLLSGGARCVQDRTWSGVRPLLVLTSVLVLFALAPTILRGPLAVSAHKSPSALFWVFLKIGSVIYGSGYVLLAFLKTDLVTQRGWLTSAQLMDAVSVGQVTPGPVFTTATFIGYVVAGPAGAISATIGIFLPAFLLCAFAGRGASALRSRPATGAFLDGVNIAAVALMAAVTWDLGRAALIDPLTITIAAASVVTLLRFKVNTTWLIAAGVAAGLASRFLGHAISHGM